MPGGEGKVVGMNPHGVFQRGSEELSAKKVSGNDRYGIDTHDGTEAFKMSVSIDMAGGEQGES